MADDVKEARTVVQDDKTCGGDPILETVLISHDGIMGRA
jgi:hypothetical protein